MKTATLLGGPFHMMNRHVPDVPPPFLMLVTPNRISGDGYSPVSIKLEVYERDGDVYGTDQPQYRHTGGEA